MPDTRSYAQQSLWDMIHLIVSLFQLPVLLISALLTSSFVERNKHKTWRRVLGDTVFRWLASKSIPQCQLLMGTTTGVYTGAVAKHGLSPVIEELGEGAKLLWIGGRSTDRVLLYIHGGGFFGPVEECSIDFWIYVQMQLKNKSSNIDIGIAILAYTLIPEASFPMPLKQAVLAISRLIASGVEPRDIHLAGDSAGGNLIGQVLLHALRPVQSVPPLTLSSAMGGACLISAWVSLTGNTGSHAQNSQYDIIRAKDYERFGKAVLVDVPESLRGYIEPAKVQESWFKGIDKIVKRVLLTAGGVECLRDDIVHLGQLLQKHHGDVKVVVQKDGVHIDMFLDFLVKGRRLGELTPLIVEWLAAGYAE